MYRIELSWNPIRRWYAVAPARPSKLNRLRRRQIDRQISTTTTTTTTMSISSTSILVSKRDQEHWKYARIYGGTSQSMAHTISCIPNCLRMRAWVFLYSIRALVRYAAFNKAELCVWMLCNVYLVPAVIVVVAVVVGRLHRRRRCHRHRHHLSSISIFSLSQSHGRLVVHSLGARLFHSLSLSVYWFCVSGFILWTPLYSWANHSNILSTNGDTRWS